MKILISADMEGTSGVVHQDQANPQHSEYERFRRLMTDDVNAAVRGAYEGGATAVIVSDGHGSGRNILLEQLDPRAHLNSGTPSPLSMVQGVDASPAGAMFVGYHARGGSQNAVLDHTWSSVRVANVWINGQLVGEIGLNAAVCGHFGVPVIFISGDQAACAEATQMLGPVEFAVVKVASSRTSAECLPVKAAQQQIFDTARRAVQNLRAGQAPPLLRFAPPIMLTVEFVTSNMADRAAIFPSVRRLDGRRVQLSLEDMPAAYRGFRALASLARE